LWLRSVVFSIEEVQIGIVRKWFKIAYTFLWFFILFNVSVSVVEYLLENSNGSDEYLHFIYVFREFINFEGIIIAYPIVCHYAARAIMVKQNAKPATFINAFPYTLLLLFGTVLGIPFMHKCFGTKVSGNSEIIIIYVIGVALFLIILVIGFIAASTGQV